MTDETPQPHEPHIRILKGQPTDEELAALIAVLGSAGGARQPAQPEKTRWGLPVDKLRYAITNYQRITLQERIRMQR
ncbi:MAG TPA: acyl-CoA carboxylase subunit epsilon [Mycobacterium sp.]|nr:acyl-CoA carboxylase subunit epsilon [Mycobacterium sp.]HUH70718.1 acyl-CoA carboxylase subunit epsilon [Mycobacterium sp.]